MAYVDSTAQSLMNAFSVNQLREVALAARFSAEKLSGLKTRDAVLSALANYGDVARLLTLAHKVEAVTPYKHCVLLESSSTLDYQSLRALCVLNFGDILKTPKPIESTERDLTPQLCIVDDATERIFLKFAHQVEVYEYKKTSDGVLKTKAIKRHIMVATINTNSQVIYIGFPGFTHAVTGDEKATYDYFARTILSTLQTYLGLELEGFKLKGAADCILEDDSEKVVDLRRTLRFKRGGRMALDSESDEDAAFALAQGLSNTSGFQISADAIRAAFRSSEAQSIVLLWQRQHLLTRLSLRTSLPEILFIWDENDPSISLIEDILQRFARARRFAGSDGSKKATSYIQEAPVGEIIRPGWLEQQFFLTSELALKILLDACSTLACSPVFRLNLGREVDATNPWVSDIGYLPKGTESEEGEVIDPRMPSNIEIAFLRRNSTVAEVTVPK